MEYQHQQEDEDHCGDASAGDRAAPGGRSIDPRAAFARCAGTSFCLLAAAWTSSAPVGVDPAALGAAMLAAALLAGLGHSLNLVGCSGEPPLDHIVVGIEMPNRHILGEALHGGLRNQADNLSLNGARTEL